MARQKNKILMFLFSLIPGAGQMYMGFMKQGLSLMTIFATLCAVGIWLDIKPLLFFAPIILLYSFFDATNKNSMDAEAFKKLEQRGRKIFPVHSVLLIANLNLFYPISKILSNILTFLQKLYIFKQTCK